MQQILTIDILKKEYLKWIDKYGKGFRISYNEKYETFGEYMHKHFTCDEMKDSSFCWYHGNEGHYDELPEETYNKILETMLYARGQLK